MNFPDLGIEVTSVRDIGARLQHTCRISEENLDKVLAHIPVGAEVTVPDPESGDCSREARRTDTGFEVKRACHGAYGTWRVASVEEVRSWLGPGIALILQVARPGYGAIIEVPKENA